MATLKALVLKDDKRLDETFNVKIRVTHNRRTAYISTPEYVDRKQLDKKMELKDPDVLEVMHDRIKKYRKDLLKISNKISGMTARQVADYLEGKDIEIDFIQFAFEYIEKLAASGQKGTAENVRTVIWSVCDFLKSEVLPIKQVTLTFLMKYERYIRAERSAIRKVKGKDQTFLLKPLTDTGVRDYIGRIRQVFKEAQKVYNNQETETILIPHYPFAAFDMPAPAKTKKRNVKSHIIAMIRDTPDLDVLGTHGVNRANFSRDVFMLCFCLVGINTVDLYYLDDYTDGRLSYKRQKIESRVGDNAFISIKVEPEILPLLDRYRDPSGKKVFNFHNMYSSPDGFNAAYNKGLKRISDYHRELGNFDVRLTGGYARASWATIARNECKVSKDDIHLALNHSNPDHKVTDIYIEEDFSFIDEANRKVLDKIKNPA